MTTIPSFKFNPRTSGFSRSVLPPASTRTPADAEAWLSEVALGLGDGYHLIWHYSKRRCRFVGFDAYKLDRSAPMISVRTRDVYAK